MQIKGINDEDFVNYKKPSMFIAFPKCTFKCETDCEVHCCQNSELVQSPTVEVGIASLCSRYVNNPITKAIVCGGLEPMDSFSDLLLLISSLRTLYKCEDDIVIYTGYTEKECEDSGWLDSLRCFNNIIVKFGRYIPDQEQHFDEVLGIRLASDNQYGKQIS